MKLLYIEDNPANLRLVEQILALRPAIAFFSAIDGNTGLALAQKHRPDLILLDINLPDMDGFAVLEQLRANPETRNIVVAALSANAMPEDVARGLRVGFDRYITKPIDVQVLLDYIDQKLSP